ncbi:MAG: phosphodiester glycosidase family protein [Bacteroidales bacterium]
MKFFSSNTFLKTCALGAIVFSSLPAEAQKGTINILDKTYVTDTITHLAVGPGTVYTQINIPEIPLAVYFLNIDAKNPHISFETVLSHDSIMGNEVPSRMATRKSNQGHVLFAGTNADFYDTGSMKGMPINGTALDGQVARKPHSSRPLMGFGANNMPFMDALSTEMSVTVNGVKTIIDEVNYPRGENKLVLYNQYNGKTTRTNNYGSEVQLRPLSQWDVNKPVQCEVVQVFSKKGTNPIRNGYVYLSGHGSKEAFVTSLKQGDIIEINHVYTGKYNNSKSQWKCLFGGDRVMLRNGEIQENDWAENHPRTGIGFSKDSTEIIMCVVDGRSTLSAGVTTKRLGDIMRSAGAYNAMNMDGGGSSAMYIKDLNVVNNVSDGSERAVANGIFAVSSAPEDTKISRLVFLKPNLAIIPGGIVRPTIISYNKYGILLNADFKDVRYTCSKEIGYIDENGCFVATTPGAKGIIEADYNGIKAVANVKILESLDSFSFDLSSIILDGREDYPVKVFGKYKGEEYELTTSVLEWEIKDPSVCSVNDGMIKGLKNGETKVIGRIGSATDTLYVKVEIAPDFIVHENFSDVSSFSLSSTSTITTKSLDRNEDGTALNFIYKKGRGTSLTLSKQSVLYSKPDTIKFSFHNGESMLNKVSMKLKVGNSVSSIIINNDEILPNAEQEIFIDVTNDIIKDTDPDKVYPIIFESLIFYLKDASHTVDTPYSIKLNNISLSYKDVALSSDNIEFLSRIRVYPNPVTNKVMYLSLCLDQVTDVSTQLYNLQGQFIQSESFKQVQNGEVALQISHLPAGTYILKVAVGNKFETVKVQIKN